MSRPILGECGGWGRGLVREPGRWGTVRTRWGWVPSIEWLRRWLGRKHGTRHESWRGSCVGGWEIRVKSIGRRGASELSSRWWRTVRPRPIAWVESRGAGIHAIGGHLSNRGPVPGRWLCCCRRRSPTTLVQFMRGFIYWQPDSHGGMKSAASQRGVQTEY